MKHCNLLRFKDGLSGLTYRFTCRQACLKHLRNSLTSSQKLEILSDVCVFQDWLSASSKAEPANIPKSQIPSTSGPNPDLSGCSRRAYKDFNPYFGCLLHKFMPFWFVKHRNKWPILAAADLDLYSKNNNFQKQIENRFIVFLFIESLESGNSHLPKSVYWVLSLHK